MSKGARIVAAAFLLTMTSASLLAARVEKLTLMSRGKERRYYLYVPDGVGKDTPAPLLITLHGSGRIGSSLVEKWRGIAEKARFIVAGPDSIDSRMWSSPDDGPQLLHDLVEELKNRHAIDTRRIYLFGHSAGAVFALQMGLLQSQYFAAVAVHAGALPPDVFSMTSYATRKIPFGIFVGTRDAFFPLEAVRATRDHLQKTGFIAEMTEIRNHTHDYYGRSGSINKDAWTFLEGHSLSAEPKFTVYSNMR
jgi:poly(3-hydroxybutyrate) depolymerase